MIIHSVWFKEVSARVSVSYITGSYTWLCSPQASNNNNNNNNNNVSVVEFTVYIVAWCPWFIYGYVVRRLVIIQIRILKSKCTDLMYRFNVTSH